MKPTRPRSRHAGYILLVDDNDELSVALGQYLEAQGYSVDFAADGPRALSIAEENTYDAIVLDGVMPGMDGLEVARRLRTDLKLKTPLLMLTGRTALDDKVAALDAGADDYLCKPFELRELLGRLHALLRREHGRVVPDVLRVGDLILDTGTLEATREGQTLMLTPIGLRLLEVLMRESPRVVTRARLERVVWGDTLPVSITDAIGLESISLCSSIRPETELYRRDSRQLEGAAPGALRGGGRQARPKLRPPPLPRTWLHV